MGLEPATPMSVELQPKHDARVGGVHIIVDQYMIPDPILSPQSELHTEAQSMN